MTRVATAPPLSVSVSPATVDDLDASPTLRGRLTDNAFALSARTPDRDGAVAVVVVDCDGSEPQLGVPRLHLEVPAWHWEEEDTDAVGTLLAAVSAELARRGHTRSVVAWDTMDTSGQRGLQELGFRPSGVWPYFPPSHPRGPVEYVMGYRDPVGSVVDLELECSNVDDE